jgi:hypothetical protein
MDDAHEVTTPYPLATVLALAERLRQRLERDRAAFVPPLDAEPNAPAVPLDC